MGAVYGERWKTVKVLGKGGQGLVYLVLDVKGRAEESGLISELQRSMSQITGAHTVESLREDGRKFIEIVSEIAGGHFLRNGALKQLLPLDEAVNAKCALERMKVEVEVMKSVQHQGLVGILDDRLDEQWFVMDYLGDETLDKRIDRYRGKPLEALKALRPVVEAVSLVHEKRIVHRDIKPGNIFLGQDGHLVLGDFGLAFKMEGAERVTDTFENVGTRDYMPGWAQTMRVADVTPAFDVFSLGKLLWVMVAGQPRMPLWYFTHPDFDLLKKFPESIGIVLVQEILSRTVVEFEKDCLATAGELLAMITRVIGVLERGLDAPRRNGMRCRVCGLGEYVHDDHKQLTASHMILGPGNRVQFYICTNCGHIDWFYFDSGQTPPGWKR